MQAQAVVKASNKQIVAFPQQQAAYTVAQFARLFGKEKTWGYRMLYANMVKVLPPEATRSGEFMVPHSEVERLLSGAVPYSDEIAGKAVPKRKAEQRSQR
jgi:hypothetical protein